MELLKKCSKIIIFTPPHEVEGYLLIIGTDYTTYLLFLFFLAPAPTSSSPTTSASHRRLPPTAPPLPPTAPACHRRLPKAALSRASRCRRRVPGPPRRRQARNAPA